MIMWLIGLIGFVAGIVVMVGYGYSVAFLTLVRDERRAAQDKSEDGDA